uniref:Proline rich membrane anchor 1 n=1 Tax=Panagrellus redivivus TaxID=6233 RepID=A0A7E4VJK9_PANRE
MACLTGRAAALLLVLLALNSWLLVLGRNTTPNHDRNSTTLRPEARKGSGIMFWFIMGTLVCACICCITVGCIVFWVMRNKRKSQTTSATASGSGQNAGRPPSAPPSSDMPPPSSDATPGQPQQRPPPPGFVQQPPPPPAPKPGTTFTFGYRGFTVTPNRH